MKKTNLKRFMLGLSALMTLGSISIRQMKYKTFNPCIFETKNKIQMEYSDENYFDEVIVPYQNKINMVIEKIQKYSNVYNLKETKINELIKNNTDLFKSEKLLTTNDKEIEKELLLTIIDIKSNPKDYNVQLSDIESNEEYIPTMKIREMVTHYAELFDLEADFPLAIECWESGYYKQPIATSYNNPGGLNGKKESLKFANLEQGIIKHITILRYNYFDKGRDTFAEIERIYTEDKGHWLSSVTSIYNKIKKGELILYYEKNLTLTKK